MPLPAGGAVRKARGRIVHQARREIEEEWRTCHLRIRKKGKGDVGVEKEREKKEKKERKWRSPFVWRLNF